MILQISACSFSQLCLIFFRWITNLIDTCDLYWRLIGNRSARYRVSKRLLLSQLSAFCLGYSEPLFTVSPSSEVTIELNLRSSYWIQQDLFEHQSLDWVRSNTFHTFQNGIVQNHFGRNSIDSTKRLMVLTYLAELHFQKLILFGRVNIHYQALYFKTRFILGF